MPEKYKMLNEWVVHWSCMIQHEWATIKCCVAWPTETLSGTTYEQKMAISWLAN